MRLALTCHFPQVRVRYGGTFEGGEFKPGTQETALNFRFNKSGELGGGAWPACASTDAGLVKVPVACSCAQLADEWGCHVLCNALMA